MARKAPKKPKSRVNEAGNYTKPELRKRLFNRIKAGSKGGKPGQWSARKAQMLAVAYKKAGGGYKTRKACPIDGCKTKREYRSCTTPSQHHQYGCCSITCNMGILWYYRTA